MLIKCHYCVRINIRLICTTVHLHCIKSTKILLIDVEKKSCAVLNFPAYHMSNMSAHLR